MAALDALIDALRRLPGVGQKSAQRMAYHLLQHDREAAANLAQRLAESLAEVRHCQRCNTFTDEALCHTCADAGRDPAQLCVVESPADQAVLERTGSYHGYYFVLLGRLSPLDGLGARDIGLPALAERALDGLVREVVVATGFTAEGEVTAQVIAQALRPHGIRVTRLARGVPVGSDLEYVDLGTIAHAYADRR